MPAGRAVPTHPGVCLADAGGGRGRLEQGPPSPGGDPVTARYHDCLRCGACCRSLILEAGADDARWEPRIAAECLRLDGGGEVPPEEVEYSLNEPGRGGACHFLTRAADGRAACAIHASRPEMCAAFVPGGAYCRRLREEGGR